MSRAMVRTNRPMNQARFQRASIDFMLKVKGRKMKNFEITYIEGDVINKKMTVKSDTISKALITFTLLCGIDATDITGIVEVD